MGSLLRMPFLSFKSRSDHTIHLVLHKRQCICQISGIAAFNPSMTVSGTNGNVSAISSIEAFNPSTLGISSFNVDNVSMLLSPKMNDPITTPTKTKKSHRNRNCRESERGLSAQYQIQQHTRTACCGPEFSLRQAKRIGASPCFGQSSCCRGKSKVANHSTGAAVPAVRQPLTSRL
jgi:hypothetical protein